MIRDMTRSHRPQPGDSATQAHASLYALRGIPQVLAEFGALVEPLLHRVSLTRARGGAPLGRMPDNGGKPR